ncbi:MAG: DUF3782 domain-containing protein [Methylovulum sp.]|nr:DUF3782 domain-containing protein [Methylovulum sp.]
MSLSQPTLADVWKLFQETDRRFQETDRKMQETDRKMQETDRKMQETDRKIKQVTESIGRLGNKLGDFVEEMVRPAAVRLFQERGIDVHEVHQNVSAQRDGAGIEIDLLVVNDTDVIAVECKSTLSVDDIDEHVKRLEKLKRLLPAYANKRVMGAVTAMVLPDNVAHYAYRQGLYVIAQTGDHLIIRNVQHFIPAIW